MAYQRSFKRVGVKDPEQAKAYQQIDEEIGKLLDLLHRKINGVGVATITVGPTAPANPQPGDLWVDTSA